MAHWRKIVLIGLLLGLSLFADEKAASYQALDDGVLYDGHPIFHLKDVSGWVGPVVFDDGVLFISRTDNIAARFRDGRLQNKKQYQTSKHWGEFPMPRVTYAIIKLDKGVLIYDNRGYAYFVSSTLKVRKVGRLNTDYAVDGAPILESIDATHRGVIRVMCCRSISGERYVDIDLEKEEIVGKGAGPRANWVPHVDVLNDAFNAEKWIDPKVKIEPEEQRFIRTDHNEQKADTQTRG